MPRAKGRGIPPQPERVTKIGTSSTFAATAPSETRDRPPTGADLIAPRASRHRAHDCASGSARITPRQRQVRAHGAVVVPQNATGQRAKIRTGSEGGLRGF
jgi:hypothetical protein